jgi:hypothetical protein
VPVPETPVDEDRGPETGEHQIGTTEKLAIVQAETESTCMQAAAQQQFGFRVLAANVAHVEPTLRRSQDIRHSALYYTRWCPNRIYGFDACARRFSFVFAKSHVACQKDSNCDVVCRSVTYEVPRLATFHELRTRLSEFSK